MKKNKLLTKDQISEKYKKMRIAAIVGYCLNALLLLLIVLSMVFGSNNVSSVSAQNELQPRSALVQRDNATYQDLSEYNYIYTLNQSGRVSIDTTEQDRIFNSISGGVSVGPYPESNLPLDYLDFTLSVNGLYSLPGGYVGEAPVLSFLYKLYRGSEDTSQFYYKLYRIRLLRSDNSFVFNIASNIISEHDYYFYSIDYNFASFSFLSSNEYLDNYAVNYFFTRSETSSFTFNSSFNFNAPLGGTINNKFMSISGVSDTSYTITYDTGVFLSNGKLYDSIKLIYWRASLYLFSTEDGSYELGPSNQYTFKEMYYHPYGASVSASQLVCSRDTGDVYISGTWTPYQLQTVTWHNDEYRHILFLQTLSDDLIRDINAFNNNTDLSINNYNSGSFLNVFTLVASAITGLMPILNMVILPGVTIGILLFIPLVAMLVFAIIRIIKK